MSRIRILSEHIANQIAAGEVVERPASVVKELLENAIDAGARQVHIEIEGSGTRLIRVIDDGTGMDADDVLLCLERHATSKLGEDTGDSSGLAAIRSLGFRGEAIPSIASVSKMTITSRTENNPLGTRVEVRYGKIVKIHETGCNKGTVIEVKGLFGNLPARKKFLKSTRTELFHIEEIIKNYSLANHRLGLTYTVDNNRVLDLGGNTDTMEERVRMLYGSKNAPPLIPIGAAGDHPSADDPLGITGFLLAPEQAFGATAKLRLFVNGRAVKDRMMAHGVAEGLSGYLMKGRTAAGVLFVTVPFDAVDVNVHPTKQEIRFQQPDVIHRHIVTAVRQAMTDFQQLSRQTIFGSSPAARASRPESVAPVKPGKAGASDMYRLWDAPADPGATAGMNQPAPVIPSDGESIFSPAEGISEAATAEPIPPFQAAELPDKQVPDSLKAIGQFMDLYLLCEAKSGDESMLVVIDQHAVHERILFENLKKQHAANQMASQALLFPKMLELPPAAAEILEKNMAEVRSLGLVVEEFGGNSYIIKAVPALISHLDPEEILTGIITQFSGSEYCRDEGRRRADATRLDDILASMACKAAVKAGQNLNDMEMQQLLKLMKESEAFTHCPHGRPVVRMFPAADIKKWFHRT